MTTNQESENTCKAIAKSTRQKCKNPALPGKIYCDKHQHFYTRYLGWREKNIHWIGLLGVVAGIVTFVITVLAFIPALTGHPLINPAQEKMAGDFRVAIAEFTEIGDSSDKDLGKGIAKDVELKLNQNLREVNPSLTITVWGPEKVGVITGGNPETRESNARSLAERINADIVIFGDVNTTQSVWQVTPKFYISGKNNFEVADIFGQHEFGSPISLIYKYNIAGRVEFGEQMTIRTQVVSKLAIGLAYYAAGQYQITLEYFTSTLEIPNWKDDQGKKVLYLLIGNAYGRVQEYELAQNNYEKALSLDPEYVCAFVGLGSVAYDQAIAPFKISENPADTDNTLLGIAITRYSQALQAKNKPVLSDIDIKVHFGIGQCYFARVYSGNETSYDPSIKEFNFVIDAYNNGENPRIRELAAEAHARLGLIFRLLGLPDRAADEYEHAASLSYDNPDRQLLFQNRADDLREKIKYP